MKILLTLVTLVVAMIINGVTLELFGTRMFGVIALFIAFFTIRYIWSEPEKPRTSDRSSVKTYQPPITDLAAENVELADTIPNKTSKPTPPSARKISSPPVLEKQELSDTSQRKTEPLQPKKSKATQTVRKPKSTEVLPPVYAEPEVEEKEPEFVKYDVNFPSNLNAYPIFRFPAKGTVIRSHRRGSTKRQGYKEPEFYRAISGLLSAHFEVLNDARINTGPQTRPYEPDIAIIGKGKYADLRIDIEVDEPYAGITRQATHCLGDDTNRDIYFQDRGWIVLRFSEIQVHQHLDSCLKKITDLLLHIYPDLPLETMEYASKLANNKAWDLVQAQKWEKERYRENYLNHEFKRVEGVAETGRRDLNEQEKAEEQLVVRSSFGEVDTDVAISFNRKNQHRRDARLKFFPESHVYTLDGVPIPSVSELVARFFPAFDSVRQANITALTRGTTPKKLLAQWKQVSEEARNKGTYLHQQIEQHYLGKLVDRSGEFQLFEDFLKDHSSLQPHRSEWRIYDEEHMIAGTIDLVVNENGQFDIYDWKRSKNVTDFSGEATVVDRWGKFGIGPLSHVSDTSFNRYALQQNIYRYILERNYGIEVGNMYLVVLHENYTRHYKYRVPLQSDEVTAMLKENPRN